MLGSVISFLLLLLVVVVLIRTFATGPRSPVAPKCSPLDVDYIQVNSPGVSIQTESSLRL